MASLTGVAPPTGTAPQMSADLESCDISVDVKPGAPFAELYVAEPFSCKSFFPPLLWVPRYIRSMRGTTTPADTKWLGTLPNSVKGDVIAGLTVGMMLVPQSLAFALLAGMPVQTGLYSSFLSLLVYACFGTMRQVQTGPTALMCLLTGQALDAMGIMNKDVRMAGGSLLALFVGLCSLLLGLLRFGGIVDFMSHSVMSSFCTASGVIIVTSQIKDMLGLKIARTHYWWENVEAIIEKLPDIHWGTVALSVPVLIILLFLKQWKAAGSKDKRAKHCLWRFLPKDRTRIPFKALKLVADLSSFLAVVLGSLIAWAMREGGVEGIRLVGDVNADGFIFVAPGKGHFEELTATSDLFISAIVISVVGFLETIAVGGKFAAQFRYEYEPNQDLIALGLSNCASAIMSGFPVTGGFSRTAVNVAFGATSLSACAISSLLVVAAMYFLLPLIASIPLCCLAPIIIQGAMTVIDIHEFKVALKARPSEFLVMFATLAVSLGLTVKEGLVIGFVLSVMKTLADISRPNMALVGKVNDGWRDVRYFPDGEQPQLAAIVRMDARLHFTNSRRLKEFAIKAIAVREESLPADAAIKYLILDMKSVNGIDMSGLETLHVLAEYLHSRQQSLVLVNLKAPIAACLQSADMIQTIKSLGGHVCLDIGQALAVIKDESPNWVDAEDQVKQLVHNAVVQENAKKIWICRAKIDKAETDKAN